VGKEAKSNSDLVRSTYEGSPNEKARNLLALLARDVDWTEAAGFPYAGTYTSAEAISANVFDRIAADWIDYRSDIEQIVAEGETVVVFGWYSGTYRATSRPMRAAFAHRWLLREGRIIRFFQYVDSHMVRQAMTAK
jgi:ketosteroid isomerase-like protein